MLSTYDRAISMYTQLEFGRSGINCVLNTRVAAVRQGEVTLINACVASQPPPPSPSRRRGSLHCGLA